MELLYGSAEVPPLSELELNETRAIVMESPAAEAVTVLSEKPICSRDAAPPVLKETPTHRLSDVEVERIWRLLEAVLLLARISDSGVMSV